MKAVATSPAAHPRTEASPTPPSDRKLRPKPHRSPSSGGVTVKPAPAPRPPLLDRPSISVFVTDSGNARTPARYSVVGSCQSCMAAARDAYDNMHAAHVTDKGKRGAAP